ncbi:hypothetical protein AGMMS49574_10700 [Bacteroidia bacterium]|nr:hypothetical protein AGMMS49574_10700 [Bacteroidia bacterium]
MENIEKLSRAVSMSAFDAFSDIDIIIPAYFLAGFISDEMWSNNKKLTPYSTDGKLKTLNKRTNDLQKYMNHYEFTTLESYPGGDPWGLVSFEDEKKRLGNNFIENIKNDIDISLKHIARYNPESQFAKLLQEPFYKNSYYPRYRNELVEVMNAYSIEKVEKNGEIIIKGSGKCGALLMVAVGAAIAHFKIPYESICIIGSRDHVVALIELEDNQYCIWNNRWKYSKQTENKSKAQIDKQIERFENDIIPKFEDVKQDYFFYPAYGMCNFEKGISNVCKKRVENTFEQLKQLIGIDIEVQENSPMRWIEDTVNYIPNPIHFENVDAYRNKIYDLAREYPFSIYDYSKYAYRDIYVAYPQAYIIAARRDYHTLEKSKNIKFLDDAFSIVNSIPFSESIFKSRDRIALPDEVLLFNNGNDRDRALLLYCLLSNLVNERTSKLFIGFSQNESYVKYGDVWINSITLESSNKQPPDLQIVFNDTDKLL